MSDDGRCKTCGTITNIENGMSAIPPYEEPPQPVGWPDALWKARCDPFTYVMCLRNGQMWRFESACVCVDAAFVHLVYVRAESSKTGSIGNGRGPSMFDRGVDVRIADIVWVADCPEGS